MKVCKLIVYDIKEGIKWKRYLLLAFVMILQCMIAQIDLDNIISFYMSDNGKYSYCLRELLLEIFSGCEPILMIEGGVFPYEWFALFVCPLFLTFDYLHKDMTQFGIQVLSRIKQRKIWWYSKCIWNIISITLGYAVIIAVILLFCLTAGIPVKFEESSDVIYAILSQTNNYILNETLEISFKDVVFWLIHPYLVMVSLSMMQMVLSLFFKSIYCFIISMCWLILSVVVNWNIAFTRIGMIQYTSLFYKNGFPINIGDGVCLFLIVFFVFMGSFIFQKFDILPDREENK